MTNGPRRVFIEDLRAPSALVYDFSRFPRIFCSTLRTQNSEKINSTNMTQIFD